MVSRVVGSIPPADEEVPCEHPPPYDYIVEDDIPDVKGWNVVCRECRELVRFLEDTDELVRRGVHKQIGTVTPGEPGIETEHRHVYAVAIETFGNPATTMLSQLENLCMLLQRGWPDRPDGTPRFSVVTEDGRRVIYDALAADGEHDDHETVLRILPVK